MKTIHLLRHAKSSWSNPGLADDERPLNKRGQKACGFMAQPMAEAGCRFERVFASPAQRAQQTIEGVIEALGRRDIDWSTDSTLYTFNSGALLDWLQRQDDANDQVMLVSHNPGITDLANILGDQPIDNVPTCGYVQLHAEIESWQQLGRHTASTYCFLYPKMFDGRQ